MESYIENNTENVGLRLPSAKESIEFASKLLRRKIPQAGHLMTPRRLWMQTIPTVECDVVIMTSPGISDNMLMWLLSKLKASEGIGLNVHVKQHGSTDSYLFYITAPFNLLLNCAEKLHLPKRVISDCGGGLKEFVQSEAHLFQCIENKENFFTMPERQWLILHLLETLRAQHEECIENLHLIPGQTIISKCVSQDIIQQIFPLHDMPALKQLRMSWVRAFLDKQPIDNICDYFGVKISMYFAWLGHYTTSLIAPAVVGFLFWIGLGRGGQTFVDVGFVLFSFFNVIWFSVYIEAWKRYSAELAYKWGTLDQRDELLLEPRPLFTGTLEVSSVTGRLEPTYPAWKRNMFRYLVSLPIIALCISIVFAIMIISFKIQDWWDTRIADYNYPFFLSFIPKILLAIVISILDEAYFKVACWLNDQENYRLETKYENNLIIKVSMFQFVNSFISLFYIAFYLQDQGRLKVQLAVLLITRQIICNIKESALPYLIEQFRLAKLSFDMFGALSPTEAGTDKWKDEEPVDDSQSKHATGNNRIISQAELESTLFKYEGTFSEHLEMFIQLGYVVLFSSAFPMAAFLALLNNILEIRSDAFKMCFIYQRPFVQRVANIGMWQNIMEVMGFIAVLVNCALIALSGQVHRMFPDMSKTQTILLIVCLEHIMLTIRFLISCAIPDLPQWVATEMAKTEFARREATRLSFANTTPPSAANTGIVDEISVGRFLVVGSKSNGGPLTDDSNVNIDVPGDSDLLKISSDGAPLFYTKEEGTGRNGDNDERLLKKYPSRPQQRITSAVSSMQLTKNWVESTVANVPSSDYDYHATVNTETGLATCWKNNDNNDRNRPNSRFHLSSPLHRSAVCLPSATSSPLSSLFSSGEKIINRGLPSMDRVESATTTGSDTSSVAEESGSLTDPSPLDDRKRKLKPTFIKRARSVAIFSLKLKERRAKAGSSSSTDKQHQQDHGKASFNSKVTTPDKPIVGGELSCVPIEMLVSLDDLQKQHKKKLISNSNKM